MDDSPDISVVVPCFNEEAALPLFHESINRVRSEMAGVSFEIIFVDDGSNDGTRQILAGFHHRDPALRCLSFSRNFGKEAAMLAGLEAARGKCVAIMDADLQDPPSLLPAMHEAVVSGACDCAAARRVSRTGEPLIRSLFARMFYQLMKRIPDARVVDGERDFRLMSRKVVDAVLSLKESNRFSKGIYAWLGFRTQWFDYDYTERAAGGTKYSFWRLVVCSFDGITAFTTSPLSFASVAGIGLCLLALVVAGVVIATAMLTHSPVPGFSAVMIVVVFLAGVQLLSIGILGKYLAKTYLETRNRPQYIIRESSEDHLHNSGRGR